MEENKKDERVWWAKEVDDLSYKLENIHEKVAYVCMDILGVLAVWFLFEEEYLITLYLLLVVPFIVFDIYVWKLIRRACVVLSFLLLNICHVGEMGEEEE